MTDKIAVKADFADRLRTAIERKGWSMSETARRASMFLGDDDKFGRAHVWQYVQGKSLPRLKYLEALSAALQVKVDELVPADILPAYSNGEQQLQAARPAVDQLPSGQRNEFVHVRDYGDGSALLEIHQRVSWETALAVLQVLKSSSR
jgi:transcriptional regulator with XRE-family HTH domain